MSMGNDYPARLRELSVLLHEQSDANRQILNPHMVPAAGPRELRLAGDLLLQAVRAFDLGGSEAAGQPKVRLRAVPSASATDAGGPRGTGKNRDPLELLHELLVDLRAEADQIRGKGPTLTDDEQRRVEALSLAAYLVHRAFRTLSGDDDTPGYGRPIPGEAK